MGWVLWETFVRNDKNKLLNDWFCVNNDFEEQWWSSQFVLQAYFTVCYNKPVDAQNYIRRVFRNHILLHKINGLYEWNWRRNLIKILWAFWIKDFRIYNSVDDKISKNYEILIEDIDCNGSWLWSRARKIINKQTEGMCGPISSTIFDVKNHTKRKVIIRRRRWGLIKS